MNISELDTSKCIFCNQPFQHRTTERNVKGTEMKELRYIAGHPKCEQLNKKIVRTHKQIQKLQVKLSETRMNLVGLKFEEFYNRNPKEKEEEDQADYDNECVIAILKKKDIL